MTKLCLLLVSMVMVIGLTGCKVDLAKVKDMIKKGHSACEVNETDKTVTCTYKGRTITLPTD